MGPIQVIPPGLMGLLQLKQEGRLPGILADTVAGVIELKDWYLTARRVTETVLFGSVPSVVATQAASPGVFQFLAGGVPAAVPQNQIWWVEQVSSRCTGIGVAATDLVRFDLNLQSPQSQGVVEVTPDVSDYQQVLRTRTQSASNANGRGFWALPGDIFGVQVWDLVVGAGNATFTLKIRATPCPI